MRSRPPHPPARVSDPDPAIPGPAADVLADFRAAERAADAVLLIDDAAAIRLAVAWRYLAPDWRPPTNDPPADLRARWAWLWTTAAQPDFLALSTVARVPTATVRNVFESLRRARLIYPDGSANRFAIATAEIALALFADPDGRRKKKR